MATAWRNLDIPAFSQCPHWYFLFDSGFNSSRPCSFTDSINRSSVQRSQFTLSLHVSSFMVCRCPYHCPPCFSLWNRFQRLPEASFLFTRVNENLTLCISAVEYHSSPCFGFRHQKMIDLTVTLIIQGRGKRFWSVSL